MKKSHTMEWGLNSECQVLLSKKYIDKDTEYSAKDIIEDLIERAHLQIEFQEERKKSFNDKEIRELKELKKLFSKYCDNQGLLDIFYGANIAKMNGYTMIKAKKEFFNLATKSVYDCIDDCIRINETSNINMSHKKAQIKRLCYANIKDVLKKCEIKDFAVKAQELMTYNGLAYDFSH